MTTGGMPRPARRGGDRRRCRAPIRRRRPSGDDLRGGFDAPSYGEPRTGGAATYWSPERQERRRPAADLELATAARRTKERERRIGGPGGRRAHPRRVSVLVGEGEGRRRQESSSADRRPWLEKMDDGGDSGLPATIPWMRR